VREVRSVPVRTVHCRESRRPECAAAGAPTLCRFADVGYNPPVAKEPRCRTVSIDASS
jgi:hypothetical protein